MCADSSFYHNYKDDLIDKSKKFGISIERIINLVENKITAWKFATNNHAIEGRQKLNDSLTAITHRATNMQITTQ